MLNPNYTVRNLTTNDAHIIAKLITEYNIILQMPETMSMGAIRQLWSQPYFKLSTDAWLILDDDKAIAYAQVQGMPPYDFVFYWGCEHPDYFGQGLRQNLLELAETRSEELAKLAAPDQKVGLRTYITGADTENCTVLEDNGWQLESRYLILEMSLNGDLPMPEFGANFTLKSFDPENQALMKMIYEAEHEAFAEQDTFYTSNYDIWKARMTTGNFDANLWALAMDGDELAGFAICQANRNRRDLGWVRVIGVRPRWRKQGLGLALMYQAFHNLKNAGMLDIGLQVHDVNPTGALNLYKRAGLSVIATKNYYEKDVFR